MKLVLALLVAFSPGSVCLHPEAGLVHWTATAAISCPCHVTEPQTPLNETQVSRKSHPCSCIDTVVSAFDVTKGFSQFNGIAAALLPQLRTFSFSRIVDFRSGITLQRTVLLFSRSRLLALLI